MRLFQNAGISPAYQVRLRSLRGGARGFGANRQIFLDDRYGASHTLLPVLDGRPEAFFTNGDDEFLQREWARERGMPKSADLASILLAQIEEHRAEVFYNLDPIRYGGTFARRLPGCVRASICWRAAPSHGLDLTGFDLLVCNFPSIIERWQKDGLRGAYFAPAHDPAMDQYADNHDRSIDVAFLGGYSRHHGNRARVLDAVARLGGRYRVYLGLDRSRLTRLAETPLGLLPPLRRYRRPRSIRRISERPAFGRDLYRLLATTKIVLNGAVDMAGADRGNMRCFEALGCGALLVSDAGTYPAGFASGQNVVTYDSPEDAAAQIVRYIDDWASGARIALAGRRMIRQEYSKDLQWSKFQALVERI